jgi:transposase-like protein
MRRDAEAEPVPRVERCPACQSSDVRTTCKATDEAPYWRCLSCGEIWNVARRVAASASRFGYRR